MAGLVLTASGDDGFVLCPFRRCTGGYCPGCGGTRAANRLARGDMSGAWQQHPWAVLAALQALALGALWALAPDRRERLRSLWLPLAITNSVLAIAIWVVRLRLDSIPTGWLG